MNYRTKYEQSHYLIFIGICMIVSILIGAKFNKVEITNLSKYDNLVIINYDARVKEISGIKAVDGFYKNKKIELFGTTMKKDKYLGETQVDKTEFFEVKSFKTVQERDKFFNELNNKIGKTNFPKSIVQLKDTTEPITISAFKSTATKLYVRKLDLKWVEIEKSNIDFIKEIKKETKKK